MDLDMMRITNSSLVSASQKTVVATLSVLSQDGESIKDLVLVSNNLIDNFF